ncbi:hypothetical protein IFY68_05560 (plasmid) [Klebsiella pneumoniae]|uniref:hypothetical protein n=1 Tax=Klebsiella pneumoniae TaxID=573 RepID=UPI0019325A19|nr:hypothetical protein [Klebsiella pneumoniae]HAU4452520.1 hypothetical protein [Citrobacter freundii]HDP6948185.1 hypothetical protein [Escherichia coli]EIX9725736.1 hypothetical protein [Klebsiella pneumoniae]QRC83517.1 hypothetical protein IFY68_05560 [Klebsiella pneumoniae]HAU4515413.1 hypothetical protein [Citrobacter freundii]
MNQKITEFLFKKSLGKAIEKVFLFSFILFVFLFLHWIASTSSHVPISMVIFFSFIVFIGGAKSMKINLLGERLNLMTRRYLNIIFP